MKLNRFEKALMNNPVRAGMQRHYETPLLERLGGRVDGDRALEIGCGRGVGTELILNRFGAGRVDAFDLDPEMVASAQRRLASYGDRVTVRVGDATAVNAPDATYGAVFDFGIVHHVPHWRDAIGEVARVLRPRGRFFFEEVTRHALHRWTYRTFLEHPAVDRFSGPEFVDACEQRGLLVADHWTERFRGDFIMGVATRAEAASPS